MGSVKNKIGSVAQPAEQLPFKEKVVGSLPTGPTTINRLVAKKCHHKDCGLPLHIHRVGDDITFSNCEPCLTNIVLECTGDNEMTIKAKRSTKSIRCQGCKKRHLLSTFEDITDGNHQGQVGSVSQ